MEQHDNPDTGQAVQQIAQRCQKTCPVGHEQDVRFQLSESADCCNPGKRVVEQQARIGLAGYYSGMSSIRTLPGTFYDKGRVERSERYGNYIVPALAKSIPQESAEPRNTALQGIKGRNECDTQYFQGRSLTMFLLLLSKPLLKKLHKLAGSLRCILTIKLERQPGSFRSGKTHDADD